MDNLPKDNQNNNSNITVSNLEDDLISPKEPSLEVPETSETPEIPKAPETPVSSEIEKKPENISEVPKETNKEEIIQENPKTSQEETIEIGSLDEKPSVSTLNQEITNQTDNETNSIKKTRKGKTITSFIAILLIIMALPLSLILVKQRQEIRKEAATSSGTLNICGIAVERPTENKGSNSYSITVPIKNNRSDTARIEIHTYACACDEANLSQCGTSKGKCTSTNEVISLSPGASRSYRTAEARQPNNEICGTFQADFFIVSVNGDSNCRNN